jgi:beta-lactamase superfamily II metal-dependent hydrolase
MFQIEMLPAREGDCLWITYGDAATPRHVLIDGGRKATSKTVRQKLKALGPSGRLELLIISHIDRDHIEGVIGLLEAAGGLGVEVGDVWFNAYHHLLSDELEGFGAAQGEKLSKALVDLKLPWNKAFGGGSVVLNKGGGLRKVDLAGGLTLTLLSPTRQKLEDLRPVWEKECRKAGLVPGAAGKPQGDPPELESFGAIDVDALAALAFKADGSEPNGSSIAVLAEYEGKRVLLAADAHADVIAPSLKALNGGARVKLDAFKLAHHGSAANTSSEVVALVDCPLWMVSTNGSYFEHPDQAAMARVVKGAPGATLMFNYRSDFTQVWEDAGLQAKHGFQTVYPTDNGCLVVSF